MKKNFKKIYETPVDAAKLIPLIKNEAGKDIKIKYKGPYGKTGYSKAAKCYFYSLLVCGTRLQYDPIQFHHTAVEEGECIKDLALRSCLKTKMLADVVILHSVPELWPKEAERERKENPGALIVGLTVWEVFPQYVFFSNSFSSEQQDTLYLERVLQTRRHADHSLLLEHGSVFSRGFRDSNPHHPQPA